MEDKLLTLLAVVVGGAISAFVTYFQGKQQATAATKLAEKEFALNARKERLVAQRLALNEFLRVASKLQTPERGSLLDESVAAKVTRKKALEGEAYRERVMLYAVLLSAFDSEDFATQAADAVQMFSAISPRSPEEIVVEALCSKYAEQMLKAIRATENELGIPALALRPEPVILPAEYARERTRLRVGEVLKMTPVAEGEPSVTPDAPGSRVVPE